VQKQKCWSRARLQGLFCERSASPTPWCKLLTPMMHILTLYFLVRLPWCKTEIPTTQHVDSILSVTTSRRGANERRRGEVVKSIQPHGDAGDYRSSASVEVRSKDNTKQVGEIFCMLEKLHNLRRLLRFRAKPVPYFLSTAGVRPPRGPNLHLLSTFSSHSRVPATTDSVIQENATVQHDSDIMLILVSLPNIIFEIWHVPLIQPMWSDLKHQTK
jgi:hypothetical protein